MDARFEVDKTEEGRTAHSRFFGEEAAIVDAVLERVEEASLMPEQRLIIELTILERLEKAQKESTVAAEVGDVEAYAKNAIEEIGESVRRHRHIGAITGGLAFCAFILIVRSGLDLLTGFLDGTSLMSCVTSLDMGHMIAFVSILISTRLLVMGDKKVSYNDPRKAQRRLQFVGVGVIIALVVMAIPYFDKFVVLQTASVYVLAFAALLLAVWKFSARL